MYKPHGRIYTAVRAIIYLQVFWHCIPGLLNWQYFSTESDMEDERESAADSGEEGDSEDSEGEEEEEEGSESEGEMSDDDNQMEKNTTNESGKS